ncbi:hypothetical protein OROGR_030614 [Orobanche gracilis]
MASKEQQVQYFDSDLDSDDDVQQSGDGALNPPSQEGPSVRRRIAFEDMLIIWTFKRKNLAAEHHKVMVTGYETTIGDIRMLKFGPAKINPYTLSEKVSGDSVYAWLLEGKPISPAELRTKFALIYEVIPSYGLKIGGRVEQEMRPRMLRYRYSMASEVPEFLSKELVGVLDPSERELTTNYWKFLQDDPETKPFAFQFEANHNKKKRKRSESEDEEELVPDVGASTSIATAKFVLPDIPIGPEREAFIKEIGDFVGEIAARRATLEVEALLRSHEERIITSVGDYVVNRLLAMEHGTTGQPTPSRASGSVLGGAVVSGHGGEAGSGLGGVVVSRHGGEAGCGHGGEVGSGLGGASGSAGQPTIIGAEGTAGQPTISGATGMVEHPTDKAAGPLDKKYLSRMTHKLMQCMTSSCLGEVTPPVQGILPYASAMTGAIEQPMNEKATRQEMFDPSDTQMNTMFDELVCLGEITTTAQGILAGVGGATEGLEQPIVRMYVDATPPGQSIVPYAVESSSHSPIQTMVGQAIPKVILNVRLIRRIFPARAIRSPFFHDDIRGGDTFDEYLKLEDGGMRNVGQPCGVDKTFFEEIMQPNEQLHIEHIESYMSILSSRPDFAGLNGVHSKIGLISSYFMEIVEEVFDVMHRGMRKEFQRYDHKLFDPTIEEVIPVEEIDSICLFAEAVQPSWGENMKQWIDCDKVVTVCNYNDHWGTLLLDLKRQTIWLYDSMAWKFDYHQVCNRRDVFLPMMRIVPQILKRIGYYELHRVKKTQFTQWICVSHRLRKILSSKMTVLIVVSTH